MVKLRFCYARKPDVVIWAEDTHWLATAANLGPALQVGIVQVWAFSNDELWCWIKSGASH